MKHDSHLSPPCTVPSVATNLRGSLVVPGLQHSTMAFMHSRLDVVVDGLAGPLAP